LIATSTRHGGKRGEDSRESAQIGQAKMADFMDFLLSFGAHRQNIGEIYSARDSANIVWSSGA